MKTGSYFFNPFWHHNQILVDILGICSALAVTTSLQTACMMGIAVALVTSVSCLCVSLLRNKTPHTVRMMVQLLIIATLVIVVDQFLQAFFFSISQTISLFVGLIITNCIVMGRTESKARFLSPIPAFFDGLGAGCGYGVILCCIAALREFWGAGTLFNYPILPCSWYASEHHPDRYQNCGLMLLAPAAFFIIGFFIWIFNTLNNKKRCG